jgi:hypothetical protein
MTERNRREPERPLRVLGFGGDLLAERGDHPEQTPGRPPAGSLFSFEMRTT